MKWLIFILFIFSEVGASRTCPEVIKTAITGNPESYKAFSSSKFKQARGEFDHFPDDALRTQLNVSLSPEEWLAALDLLIERSNKTIPRNLLGKKIGIHSGQGLGCKTELKKRLLKYPHQGALQKPSFLYIKM